MHFIFCLFVFLQELLGLKFTEVKDADVWHEDVKMVICLIFYLFGFVVVVVQLVLIFIHRHDRSGTVHYITDRSGTVHFTLHHCDRSGTVHIIAMTGLAQCTS